MSDRDIKNWDQRLKDQVNRGWENYLKHRIDLSIARNDEILMLAGEFFYVEGSSSAGALAAIKLNRDKNDPLTLKKGVAIESIFTRTFITNTAQAGEWLDIIVGINFKYSMRKGKGLGNEEIQVTWAAANSLSIAAANNATSDAFVFSTKASSGHIQLKADNDGAPAAGDTIDFFLLLTCGDPDGAGADEYDTLGHAIPLSRLDTNLEDPALRTVNCPITKGGAILAVNNSAGRAITVSACILQKTIT